LDTAVRIRDDGRGGRIGGDAGEERGNGRSASRHSVNSAMKARRSMPS
jgi:hypothetical protein